MATRNPEPEGLDSNLTLLWTSRVTLRKLATFLSPSVLVYKTRSITNNSSSPGTNRGKGWAHASRREAGGPRRRGGTWAQKRTQAGPRGLLREGCVCLRRITRQMRFAEMLMV